jgi:hypothetical protein
VTAKSKQRDEALFLRIGVSLRGERVIGGSSVEAGEERVAKNHICVCSIFPDGGKKRVGNGSVTLIRYAAERNSSERADAEGFVLEELDKRIFCFLDSKITEHPSGVGANLGMCIFQEMHQGFADICTTPSELTNSPDGMKASPQAVVGRTPLREVLPNLSFCLRRGQTEPLGERDGLGGRAKRMSSS